MSYLKLGKTSINYNKETTLNISSPIISEIIESSCSPVDPKLITSVNDLDLYFGTSFKNRDYYLELLQSNVYLLPFRPIKGDICDEECIIDPNPDQYDIVSLDVGNDTDKIEEIEYNYFEDLPEDGLPVIGDTKQDESTLGKWKFKVSSEDTYYIWYVEGGFYIDLKLVPYYYTLSSEVNRDSLRLINSLENFNYCHPKYSSRTYTPKYQIELDQYERERLLNSIKDHGVDNEYWAAAYILDFSDVKEFGEKDYIIIPGPNKYYQLYFGEFSWLGADVIPGDSESIRIKKKNEGDNIVKIIIDTLSKIVLDRIMIPDPNYPDDREKDKEKLFKFKIIEVEKYKKYIFYSYTLLPDLKFYSLDNLIFEKSDEITNEIYSVLSESNKRAELFSKTIGPGDEDIKVKIEKIQSKQEYYRATISRYSYSEIFEGPLYLDSSFDSLEKTINQKSKLVEIKIYNEGRSINNKEDGLTPGEYTLKGAKSESDFTPEDYWRALDKLKNTNYSEDFLLIPEIEKYELIGATSDEPWIKEYETLLDYAQTKNCQVLISNHPWKFNCNSIQDINLTETNPPEITGIMYRCLNSGSKSVSYLSYSGKEWIDYTNRSYEIEETFKEDYISNHIFNFTKDNSNRLVYFFNDMTYKDYYRPAYYVFLKSILNNQYLNYTNDIIYKSPDIYYQGDTNNLISYKSNFLSDNSLCFYYKELFNHTGDWNYDTTILVRFCIDKISNTITREFPKYLGSTTTTEIKSGLKSIINSLMSRYQLIKSISIDTLDLNYQNQTVNITLSANIDDILEKDLTLSITLNVKD